MQGPASDGRRQTQVDCQRKMYTCTLADARRRRLYPDLIYLSLLPIFLTLQPPCPPLSLSLSTFADDAYRRAIESLDACEVCVYNL